jgi:site-specific DNA-methyltransferase (adenine-specific)
MINLQNMDGLEFLESVPDNSVDLILTDPPYITSRETGMDKWVTHTQEQDKEGATNARSESQWENYKTKEEWDQWFKKSNVKEENRASRLAKMKKDYIKYGSIYGKKYAVTTDYGEWDSEFTLEKLDLFIKHYFRVLKPGGTCIIFFDIWKITNLKKLLEDAKFKQIRFLEWIKTNPQPINSKVNYLTNCREIALLGIKKSKPTFNSKYDNAIYHFPLQGGKDRFHPTQKSLPLFEELIRKHSNEGDLILDTFAGSATTAIAAINTNRQFIGTELDEEFYNKSMKRIQKALDNR